MPRLAQILTALGYRVQLRTALGGGDGADCLRNLRHSFLSVTLPSPTGMPGASGAPAAGRRYVIDPQFKEQFIIAKATKRYCSIIAAVPAVLVAPEDHLVLLVNFLCTEMSAAFRQLGSVLPPWRQASSLLSKWRPRKSVDESVAPISAAAAGQAARQRQAIASATSKLQQQQQGLQQGQQQPAVVSAAAQGLSQQQQQQQQRAAGGMLQSRMQAEAAMAALPGKPPRTAINGAGMLHDPALGFGGPIAGSIAGSSGARPNSFEPLKVHVGFGGFGMMDAHQPAPATAQAW